MIDMKKHEIAYHNYAEAKRTHQMKKFFIQTLQVTLSDRSKQPPSIMYNDILTSLRRKKVQSPA